MKERLQTLIYIHDPMCSWCWGFRPVWQQVQQAVSGKFDVRYVLGGLAPDTDLPMPQTMQNTIRETWERIQHEIPDTEFNYDFWTRCSPRRSTYPACRAVIACRMQQPLSEKAMILAIQQAYYLNSKNPSDEDVLIQLAEDIGLDTTTFVCDFRSKACSNELEDEIQLARKLNVSSFPALILSQDSVDTTIHIDYNSSDNIIKQVLQKLDSFSCK